MRVLSEVSGTIVFPSDLGWMAVCWKGACLTRITFGHSSGTSALASLESDDEGMPAVVNEAPAWITDVVGRLQAYAAGREVRFEDVRLDLAHLSEFQRQVVRACRRIGRGKVRTYGELAAIAGSPGAARAVGTVMSKNRFPIIVPCHRVVGSAGAIGGFSARNGVTMKRRMLELEGATLGNQRQRRHTKKLVAEINR